MKRQKIIVGNWKMNKTIAEAERFIDDLAPKIGNIPEKIYLAVPYTAIQPVAEKAKKTPIVVGAQNMNDATEGAFTGEIAGRMLKEAGAQFVLLGHSERRHFFHEDNAMIDRKVWRALAEGLQPIVCIGETQKERKEGKQEEVIRTQLSESLAELGAEKLGTCIIAYEPVWAIGTGEAAEPKDAQEMHHFCRSILKDLFGEKLAEMMPILYGGSVKPDNAKTLIDQADIDGLLVGGASLLSTTFAEIIENITPELVKE